MPCECAGRPMPRSPILCRSPALNRCISVDSPLFSGSRNNVNHVQARPRQRVAFLSPCTLIRVLRAPICLARYNGGTHREDPPIAMITSDERELGEVAIV